MTPARRFAPVLMALALIAAAPPPARQEGLNLNSFVKQGPVAAHIVLRSGHDPRLIVAFPAGNSGVGLWFDRVAGDARWSLRSTPQPVSRTDDRGRVLRGVRFDAVIQAPRLVVKQAVLSSIRVLRDYQGSGSAPAEVLVAPHIGARSLLWARDRLDGAPGYRLDVTVVRGSLDGRTLVADADGTIAIRVEATTGETPLTPFDPGTLFTDAAAPDPQARAALDFLAFREKFLAGSWRFDTYFGRDTLMSLRLLMPVLRPAAVESGLRSVLERLSPDGNVAHEEDIGEFAILDNLRTKGLKSARPTYNYAMIDSAFMLAPIARAWLLDDPRGRAAASAFLAAPAGDRPAADALLANIRYVAGQAAAFARDPQWRNLIALKPGMDAGEWRDSNDGLGGGRYPYDVNAVLVPAALDAAVALAHAGLLDRHADAADRAMLAQLPQIAAVWRTHAPQMFAQRIAPDRARQAITDYARSLNIPAGPALAAVGDAAVRFDAIALDAHGQPVPIVNSDDGFALLFGHPDAAMLDIAAKTIADPFPAGLMTGAGMLVADPVFADTAIKARFGPNAYHGAVIWSWQQAMVAAGLARQIARTDLPPATCAALRVTQDRLWDAIDATRAVQSSELWSWRFADGQYEVVPFGASGGDADESNAAQLWSTVYLAVQRPAAATGGCAPR